MASALVALTSSFPESRPIPDPSLRDLEISDLFRTEPVSPIEQADFFNAAVTASTQLPPGELMAVLKLCERLLGRRRGRRWGPRRLDLDLLLYDRLVIRTPELSIPHPRLAERRFYLEPLAQIAPELRVPPDGSTVGELLAKAPAATSRRERWPAAAKHLPS